MNLLYIAGPQQNPRDRAHTREWKVVEKGKKKINSSSRRKKDKRYLVQKAERGGGRVPGAKARRTLCRRKA